MPVSVLPFPFLQSRLYRRAAVNAVGAYTEPEDVAEPTVTYYYYKLKTKLKKHCN